MQTKLLTHAVVELECDCGATVVLSTNDVKKTVCECGRAYQPELRIHFWDKDEPVAPEWHNIEER